MRDISATSGAEAPGARGEPSGVVGNERLTALIGAVGLVLSVAEVEILIRVHIVSFLVWLATLAVHVVAYARRVPRLIAEDWRRRTLRQKRWDAPAPETSGRRMRLAVNIAVLVPAAIASVLLLTTAAPWVGWGGQAVTGPGVLAVAVSIGTAVAVMFQRH